VSAERTPSERALAIARGLVRSARAAEGPLADGFLHLPAANGNDYWVSLDGLRVLRGPELEFADELQPGFVEAMARSGAQEGPG
jgi:hypothetical protein